MTGKAFNSFLLAFLTATLISCGTRDQGDPGFDDETARKEVWKAVETRFSTWRDNEYDAHMEAYHPDWRRWSADSRELMKKDDFRGLWDRMKNDEQVIDLDLEPVEILFYGGGKVAIVHFISTETFLWTGVAGVNRKNEPMERGSVQTVSMRWSDVMVREDGQWLYAGGHRDFGQLEEEEKKEGR